MNKLLRTALAASVAVIALAAPAAQAQWPDRPVTIIVPWGAGGAADQLSRALAPLLEKELKVPFNVVLRPGGSGAVGHTALAQAKPDGYTWGLATVEITMMHWQGLATIQPKDFTVVAIINADAGGLMVRHGLAVQDREGPDRGHQEEARRRAQGLGHRAGRNLAPRARRVAARREGGPDEGAVGAEPGRGARDAGSRRRRGRLRHRLAARRPRVDRRRQGAARSRRWTRSGSGSTRTCRP